ncbi:GNAT family N-acetyltransferase [Mycobacterium sp.]|uniref:GNAT family N-acetyltransferase n=1 Tax=Mycobacterium sp. TaxID=1785 RepID=UPI003C72CFA6
MSPQAAECTATCELLDGRRVLLRRLGTDDAEVVAALHRNLSDYDRYFRFFTLTPVHLSELVGALLEPAVGRCALGAFDGDRLIGVANYKVASDPTVADIAVVVANEDHLCGVGTALLRRLAEIAETRGVRRFVADILADNDVMLKVASDLGWRRERSSQGVVCHLEFELPVPSRGVKCR